MLLHVLRSIAHAIQIDLFSIINYVSLITIDIGKNKKMLRAIFKLNLLNTMLSTKQKQEKRKKNWTTRGLIN